MSDVFRPLWGLAAAFGLLLVLALVLPEVGWLGAIATWNWILPMVILGCCVWTALKLTRRWPMALWTPLFWFVVITGSMCGFAPLFFTWGNPLLQQWVTASFPMTPEEFWRTHVLNLVGSLSVLVSAWIVCRLLPPVSCSAEGFAASVRLARARRAAILFLVLGAPVRYLWGVPAIFGLLDAPLPQTIYVLGQFVYLAILMCGFLSIHAGGRWRLLFVALVATELGVAMLTFSKFSVVITVLMATLGRYLGTRRISTLVWAAGLTLGAYVAYSPLVGPGRAALTNLTGTFQKGTVRQRVEVLASVLRPESREVTDDPTFHGQWWARLGYAPIQVYVLRLYDTGMPGSSFGLWYAALVPRLVWPAKPRITDVANDFNEMVFGNRDSAMSATIYAEGYWNGGWPMVVVLAGYVGALLAILSRAGLLFMGREDWIFLPCVLAGIMMALSIDNWFVASFVGPAAAYFAYYLVLLAAQRTARG